MWCVCVVCVCVVCVCVCVCGVCVCVVSLLFSLHDIMHYFLLAQGLYPVFVPQKIVLVPLTPKMKSIKTHFNFSFYEQVGGSGTN